VPPKIKICGTTNVEDATASISSGASYIGLIFAASSSRRVDLKNAKEIAAAVAGKCPLVGIFQNNPLHDVLQITAQVPLELVQLHGNESAEYCAQMTVPVIKVFSLDFNEPINLKQLLQDYCKHVAFFMFDKPKALIDPNWLSRAINSLATIEKDLPPYFFAGGLTPTNVNKVLNALQPYCLDVVSGIESRIGCKDPQLMKEFCDAVLGANRNVVTTEQGG